jgi:hypothetical protein
MLLLAHTHKVCVCDHLPVCVYVSPTPTAARQRGLLFDERRDRSFSIGALSEEISRTPPLTQTKAVLSESGSELLYDWRFAANQFVLATSPLGLTTSNSFFLIEHLRS